MGQVLNAICECGLRDTATLGAGRSDFQLVCKFPHYCKNCEYLISVDILKENNVCSECGSKDIHSYESSTKRSKYKIVEKLSTDVLMKLGLHRLEDEQFSWYLNKENHVILKGNHYCPKCHSNSMIFDTKLIFD